MGVGVRMEAGRTDVESEARDELRRLEAADALGDALHERQQRQRRVAQVRVDEPEELEHEAVRVHVVQRVCARTGHVFTAHVHVHVNVYVNVNVQLALVLVKLGLSDGQYRSTSMRSKCVFDTNRTPFKIKQHTVRIWRTVGVRVHYESTFK